MLLIERSIIISYATQNYEDISRMFKAGLYSLNIKPENLFIKREIIKFSGEDGFRSGVWYKAILNKVIHLVRCLRNFKDNSIRPHIKYFIFCDCDVFFIGKTSTVGMKPKNLLRIQSVI